MPTPTETPRGRLTTAESAAAYVLADRHRACKTWTTKVITLESTATGKHFSYQIARPPGDEGERPWLIKILVGPDNQNDFVYLGLLHAKEDRMILQHTSKSAMPRSSRQWLAWSYFTRNVLQGSRLPESLIVWHAMQCGACSRPLTHPESIERGLGPDCAARIGLR